MPDRGRIGCISIPENRTFQEALAIGICIHYRGRVAELVQRSMGRASEHARPAIPGEENEFGERPDAAERESASDEMYKHSRRTQERFSRFFEERMARGEDYDTAFEGALDQIEGEAFQELGRAREAQ